MIFTWQNGPGPWKKYTRLNNLPRTAPEQGYFTYTAGTLTQYVDIWSSLVTSSTSTYRLIELDRKLLLHPPHSLKKTVSKDYTQLINIKMFFTHDNQALKVSYNNNWAEVRQNQQNNLCAQQRLRSAVRSELSLFTVHFLGNYGSKHSSGQQRRLWSDWADAQTDLSC